GWADVEYIIGNFFWKARFVKRDGFIYTGDDAQFNIATQQFVAYHSGEVKPYNCGRCHTTGYDPNGNQGGLEGIVGTWAQPGVRCEACHGPGSDHVQSFGATPPPGGKDCDDCHYRDEQFRIPWKGGFERHHQQAEDLSHSPHRNLQCTQCHNPHRSTVYDDGGMIAACGDCHPGNAANNFYVIPGMEAVECDHCHMAKMAKSAVAVNQYRGDIHSHLFRIMTQPIAAADNTYQVDGTTFWNVDANGDGRITVDYACLSCHIGAEGQPIPAHVMTLEEAAAAAQGIHNVGVAELTVDIKVNELDDFAMLQQNQPVSVDASVLPGASDGVPATWWIVASTSFGWYYWNPIFDTWLPGLYPSLVDFAVFEVNDYNLYNDTLPPGYYTFWFAVFANDGAMDIDVVPVYVTP
ncbi:MAG: hypothetical protein GXP27_20345, partial [Planctomycetes bacterium]|nr:hypothetical protein [Planctomycetota bacterium]